MMAIGIPMPESKKIYNLTLLRKNCCPKQATKGLKADRDDDTVIIPAPGSIVKTNNAFCKTPKSDRVHASSLKV